MTKYTLTKEDVGKKVKCIINGNSIIDAKVQYQDDKIYICQNIQCGEDCSNKLGYKYSWYIDSNVKDIELVDVVNSYEIF